jgi:hypothetical protein
MAVLWSMVSIEECRRADPQYLGTTQRHMHRSPAALDAAIRLLETGADTSSRGEIVEAAGSLR